MKCVSISIPNLFWKYKTFQSFVHKQYNDNASRHYPISFSRLCMCSSVNAADLDHLFPQSRDASNAGSGLRKSTIYLPIITFSPPSQTLRKKAQ